jgi:stress response protein YsnF
VLVIPVLEEVLVVEKRLVLREELRIRRTSASEAVEVPVTLRRQHAEIDRLPARATEQTGKPNT